MIAYIKLKDKLSPVHKTFTGQEILLTIELTKNENGDEVPSFKNPIFREEILVEHDTKGHLKELKAKYKITQVIWVD